MADTTPKPFVFVLIPFDKSFDDVYQLGIKKVCDEVGAYAERIDDQIFQESILQRIYNQIAKADVIIADMTGRNPNVFYETGYAHALGKNVILLTQNADDIPFDLKHYPHIIYGGVITELIPQLIKKVRWAIEHTEKECSKPKAQVEFYYQSTSLANNPTILIKTPKDNNIQFNFDCCNLDERTIQRVDFEVALIATENFNINYNGYGVVTLPSGFYMHVIPHTFYLLPGQWKTIGLTLHKSKKVIKTGDVETFTLRKLSEDGGCDYPFKIKFKPTQD